MTFEGRSGTRKPVGLIQKQAGSLLKQVEVKEKHAGFIKKQVSFTLKQVYVIYYYKPGTKELHQSSLNRLIKQWK